MIRAPNLSVIAPNIGDDTCVNVAMKWILFNAVVCSGQIVPTCSSSSSISTCGVVVVVAVSLLAVPFADAEPTRRSPESTLSLLLSHFQEKAPFSSS